MSKAGKAIIGVTVRFTLPKSEALSNRLGELRMKAFASPPATRMNSRHGARLLCHRTRRTGERRRLRRREARGLFSPSAEEALDQGGFGDGFEVVYHARR
jgi:hypothetical protein